MSSIHLTRVMNLQKYTNSDKVIGLTREDLKLFKLNNLTPLKEMKRKKYINYLRCQINLLRYLDNLQLHFIKQNRRKTIKFSFLQANSLLTILNHKIINDIKQKKKKFNQFKKNKKQIFFNVIILIIYDFHRTLLCKKKSLDYKLKVELVFTNGLDFSVAKQEIDVGSRSKGKIRKEPINQIQALLSTVIKSGLFCALIILISYVKNYKHSVNDDKNIKNSLYQRILSKFIYGLC